MQSPQDPNSVSPEAAERIQFLLSRQLDGDLASDNSSELAEIQQSESLDRYLKSIRHIHQHLKSLPVKPVSHSFAASIRQAILDDSAKLRTSAFTGVKRGWARRLVVPATIAACALGLIVILRSGGDNSNRVALGTDAPSANHESMPQNELQPFLESDDWRIVVVQVNSKDRDDVMHDIEAIVAENDMSIRTVVEQNDAHKNRFGVLLTSIGVDEEDFINSVVPQADARSADWNAQKVAESSRASLISRLQESLKTPTYSELHFGQVYVALPKPSQSVDTTVLNLLAHDNVNDSAAFPAPAAKKMDAQYGDAPTNALPEPRKPVLVVFEFTDPSSDHI